MKAFLALCLVAILGIGAGASDGSYRDPPPRSRRPVRDPDALRSLVETERAFSARSVKDGMRDAFLAYLADSGVLFRPFPVNGKRLWTARGRSKATLIWEPSSAAVSWAGDLGYTTGPWEFRPEIGGADSASHSHFISVWRRQADQTWRLIVTPDTTLYVHVWRRAPRRWELALAVLNPVRR
jgi:ketosteroid isomerase-like protein